MSVMSVMSVSCTRAKDKPGTIFDMIPGFFFSWLFPAQGSRAVSSRALISG